MFYLPWTAICNDETNDNKLLSSNALQISTSETEQQWK